MNTLWNNFKEVCCRIFEALAPSEATQWDIMASNMSMEGYTEYEIENEIGTRPEPKSH